MPVSMAEQRSGPTQVFDRFVASFEGGDVYTLGIYKSDMTEGHSITPYDAEEFEDGTLAIYVYDNNFPGEERMVSINPETDTWSYVAAANPSDPASRYDGTAQTNNIGLTSMSVREGALQCPFCGSYQEGMSGQRSFSVTGDARLLLTDASGNRLGHPSDGSFVNEIPGSRFAPQRSDNLFTARAEPQYSLPSNSEIDIEIGDGGGTAAGDSDFGILGPGYYIGVENLFLDPGQVDHATVQQNRAAITYETSGMETPDIVLAAETGGADWLAVVRSRGDSAGQTIAAEIDFTNGGALLLESGDRTHRASSTST